MVEKWGFGTRSIIETCNQAGNISPGWVEGKGFILFQLHSKFSQQPESQAATLTEKVLKLLSQYPSLSKLELSRRLGQKKISGQLNLD